MFLNTFLQRSSNLFAENRLLKFVVVIMCLTQIWCVYRVNVIKDKVRTVIQPPVINSKIEVSGSWTSDAYVREYVRYMGALLWNYSPGTARNQFSEILVSWHPSVFNDAKQRLYVLADQIEQTRSSSVFYINKIEHNPDGNFVVVSGNRHLAMQDKSIEVSQHTYHVSYVVESGRFWILGVEEKGKDGKPIGATAQQPVDLAPEVTNEK